MSMSVKEMVVWLFGIVAATLLAGLLINACTNIQYKNADTAKSTKLSCIQHGGAWVKGNCIYSKTPAK